MNQEGFYFCTKMGSVFCNCIFIYKTNVNIEIQCSILKHSAVLLHVSLLSAAFTLSVLFKFIILFLKHTTTARMYN